MYLNIPPADMFIDRHIGLDGDEINAMLSTLGLKSLEDLVQKTIPAEILDDTPLNIGVAADELNTIKSLRSIAGKNKVTRSYIGMGYTGTITPSVFYVISWKIRLVYSIHSIPGRNQSGTRWKHFEFPDHGV
jgi:glycine cleavage system pyridoxal-binding protein P